MSDLGTWDWKPAARFILNWIDSTLGSTPEAIWMDTPPWDRSERPVIRLNFKMPDLRYSDNWNQGKFNTLRKRLQRSFGMTPNVGNEEAYVLPDGQKVEVNIFLGGTPGSNRLAVERVVAKHLEALGPVPKRVGDTANWFRSLLRERGVAGKVETFNSGYVGITIDSPQFGKWMYLDQPGVVGLEDQSPGYIWFGPYGASRKGLVDVKYPDRKFGDVDFSDAEVQRINQKVFSAFHDILDSAMGRTAKGDKPTSAETSALSAFQWGHITREQLENKIGKQRAEMFAPTKKRAGFSAMTYLRPTPIEEMSPEEIQAELAFLKKELRRMLKLLNSENAPRGWALQADALEKRIKALTMSKVGSAHVPERLLSGLSRDLTDRDLRGMSFPFSGPQGRPWLETTASFDTKEEAVAEAEKSAKKYENSHWPGGMAQVVAIVQFQIDGFWVGVVNKYYSNS